MIILQLELLLILVKILKTYLLNIMMTRKEFHATLTLYNFQTFLIK